MKLTVVGTGYVGLVSALGFASKGHKVYCVDTNPKIIDSLKRGIPHIYEKGLADYLSAYLHAGLFIPTMDLNSSLDDSDIAIIAVGTPSKNGRINLRYIRAVSRQIGLYLKDSKKFLSIIIKSTVIPGTTDTFVKGIIEKVSFKKIGEFGLGMNPEFLREGNAVEDFLNSDRIVLGYEDDRTKNLLEELYRPLDIKKVFVNTRTAEMIKYVNNALLAVLISASNEMANIAYEISGIDFNDVLEGIRYDKRWSPFVLNNRVFPEILNYIRPGIGFGGSCFPKDLEALCTVAQEHGIKPKILQSVLDVNSKQPKRVLSILKYSLGSLRKKKILVLGLAFKPETDDVRESKGIAVIKDLLSHHCIVYAHDPKALENAKAVLKDKNIVYVEVWKDYLYKVDAVIITTNWQEYSSLFACNVVKPFDAVFIDTRRMFQDAQTFEKYYSLDYKKKEQKK
jgi:UDPglucose 6-dehydrogenase/GDP-mannose 6-dehydrogenase